MAERGGFEPPARLPLRRFSKPFLSATQASLRYRNCQCIKISCPSGIVKLMKQSFYKKNDVRYSRTPFESRDSYLLRRMPNSDVMLKYFSRFSRIR